MGKLDDAEIYYHCLLKYLPSGHENVASCYYGLGIIEKRSNQVIVILLIFIIVLAQFIKVKVNFRMH